MKKLSIEEKARRYDEAIKRAQAKMEEAKVFDYDDEQTAHTIRLTTTDIFPELKESEDERIRKEMISWLKGFIGEEEGCGYTEDEIRERIAWLEKQDEHANFRNKIQIGDKVTRNEDGVLVNLSQLKRVAKKQGEQKPADTEKGAKGNEREIPNSAWSEEDESLRLRTIGALETCKIGSPTKCVDEQINWLKSLRPQNWTKEDRERYISCLQRLSTGNPEQPETINSKWFKEHVYPQSHWKPSDEQMEYLAKAITTLGNEGDNKTSAILYELRTDLKKLKG